MKYRLLGPALDDLDHIDDWIASNFGEAAAAKARRNLLETFELLAQYPGMGTSHPEITDRPVRFFVSSPNWIIYEPGPLTLIHRIFPAAMDIERLEL